MRYEVIFEYSSGQQVTVDCDHLPDLGSVIRVPGTDTYAEVISVGEHVAAGETCSNPHCASCDAGVPHETETRLYKRQATRQVTFTAPAKAKGGA